MTLRRGIEMKRLQHARQGLTLVELLVVTALVVLTFAILLPAVQRAREAARMSACADHLRQIGMALQSFEGSRRCLPAGYLSHVSRSGEEAGPGWGWAALLLNHLEESSMSGHIQFDRTIEDPANFEYRTRLLSVYSCPVARTESAWPTFSSWGDFSPASDSKICDVASANYVAMAGDGDLDVAGTGLFFRNSNIGLHHITDGLSLTIAVGERSRMLGQATWVGAVRAALLPFGIDDDGSYYLFARSSAMVLGRTGLPNLPGDAISNLEMFSSQHYSGINFVFADGHVASLSSTTDSIVFQALSTRAAGEVTF